MGLFDILRNIGSSLSDWSDDTEFPGSCTECNHLCQDDHGLDRYYCSKFNYEVITNGSGEPATFEEINVKCFSPIWCQRRGLTREDKRPTPFSKY
jgi:hypothetical protein